MEDLMIKGNYEVLETLNNGEGKLIIIVGPEEYADEQASIELTEEDVIKLRNHLNEWLDKKVDNKCKAKSVQKEIDRLERQMKRTRDEERFKPPIIRLKRIKEKYENGEFD